MTHALRALAAAVLGALLTGLVLVWPTAPAAVAHAPQARAEADKVVFTGTFVRQAPLSFEGTVPVRRYQVAVEQVFGPVDVATRRVTVRSRLPLERCGTGQGVGQGQATQGAGQGAGQGTGQGSAGQSSAGQDQAPTTPSAPTSTPTAPSTTPTTPPTLDKSLRVFYATVDSSDYVVATCKEVSLADAATLTDLTTQLGEGRAPGTPDQPAAPLEDVGYLCPDSDDAVDVDNPDSCSALEDGQSFDRAAAPGLALVIVGVLGLLVVRRVGRRRA